MSELKKELIEKEKIEKILDQEELESDQEELESDQEDPDIEIEEEDFDLKEYIDEKFEEVKNQINAIGHTVQKLDREIGVIQVENRERSEMINDSILGFRVKMNKYVDGKTFMDHKHKDEKTKSAKNLKVSAKAKKKASNNRG